MDALVVIENSPMNSVRAAEGIRISLGLLTYMDDVGILFTGDGVWTLNGLKPEKGGVMAASLDQLEKFIQMEQRVLVDSESCAKRAVKPGMEGIEMVDSDSARKAVRETKHLVTIGA